MEFAKIQKFEDFAKAVGKREGNRPSDIACSHTNDVAIERNLAIVTNNDSVTYFQESIPKNNG